MRGKPINLFMWAYQPHLRLRFETRCHPVGARLDARAASSSESTADGLQLPERI